MTKPKILLGDDHGMIRRGLSLLIKTEIGAYDIAEADSCANVMQALKKQAFTHLIIDMIFPDGSALEILPNIQALYPSLRILFFSMQPPEIHGEALRQYQVAGYLSKTTDDENLVSIVRQFLHNTRTQRLVTSSAKSTNPFSELSPRELQILHYMLNGMGTKEISDALNIKMNSVSTLKKRIYEKTASPNFKALIDLCTLYRINY